MTAILSPHWMFSVPSHDTACASGLDLLNNTLSSQVPRWGNRERSHWEKRQYFLCRARVHLTCFKVTPLWVSKSHLVYILPHSLSDISPPAPVLADLRYFITSTWASILGFVLGWLLFLTTTWNGQLSLLLEVHAVFWLFPWLHVTKLSWPVYWFTGSPFIFFSPSSKLAIPKIQAPHPILFHVMHGLAELIVTWSTKHAPTY